jgi:hypothetical protein
MKHFVLFAAISLLLGACGSGLPTSVTVPPSAAPGPLEGEGLLGELRLKVAAGSLQALQAEFLPAGGLGPQSFVSLSPSKSLRLCPGTLSTLDDATVVPSVRYLNAVLNFDLLGGSAPAAFQLVAVDSDPSDDNPTPLLNLRNAAGDPLPDAQTAQKMVPGMVMKAALGVASDPLFSDHRDYSLAEQSAQQTALNLRSPTYRGKMLNYGFVASTQTENRLISAPSSTDTACNNPATAQVGIGYKLPLESTDPEKSFPYRFELRFMVFSYSAPPKVKGLELAQTHVIPAQGRTWAGVAPQTFQNYDLHLTAERGALAFLDLESTEGWTEPGVLEAYLGGVKVGEVALNSPATLPPTEAQGPAYSKTAHWAKLSAGWVKPGLELRVRSPLGEQSEAQAVKVGAPAWLSVQTLPFYLFGLDEKAISLDLTREPNAAAKQEYAAKHPIAKLEALNHPAQKVKWPYIIVAPRQGRVAQKVLYKEQQGDGYAVMSAVLGVLGAMRQANGDTPLNVHYYAPLLMANQLGQYSSPGGGLGGGHVGTGDYQYSGTFIHEQGHAFGLTHANDGDNAGVYPYVGGSLKGSGWGYDLNRDLFLAPFVPKSASTYLGCKNSSFPKGRQIDEQGRCIKQDPMQSGSGDQMAGDLYTMFSDWSVAFIQRYFEGVTTLENGQRKYSGGRWFVDPASNGYQRWDSLSTSWVPVTQAMYAGDKGLYGLNGGLPLERGVAVHTLLMTAQISGASNAYPLGYDPDLTQIYPPLSFNGNLSRLLDPSLEADRNLVTPNVSANPWFCLNSGCDYSVRVTYTDGTVRHVLLQGGFRKWYSTNLVSGLNTPTSSESFHLWAVNVPAQAPLSKVELLETPQVYSAWPLEPRVIATRTLP